MGGGGGTGGGWNPGVMGAGGLREVGEEGAGGRISQRGGSREKWEKFRNIGTIFHNRKSTRRREPLWRGGNWEYRVREAGSSDPPVPPPHHSVASSVHTKVEFSLIHSD